jgi:protein-S-isoprenylcysteine O-methyltransferase Ste14
MNSGTTTRQTDAEQDLVRGIARYGIMIGVFTLIQVLGLFLAAGRLDWPMGWVYGGMLVLNQAVTVLILIQTNPHLLVDRARNEGPRDLDRVLSGVMSLFGPITTLIVAGLDYRWSWSPHLAFWLQLAGVAVVILGDALATWAIATNRHFYGVYRVKADGSQAVATAGPYRLVRHPGYLGACLFILGTPFILGSLWALIPAALTVAATVARTALEDPRLQRELPGYQAYARHTRYRLVPGLW